MNFSEVFEVLLYEYVNFCQKMRSVSEEIKRTQTKTNLKNITGKFFCCFLLTPLTIVIDNTIDH